MINKDDKDGIIQHLTETLQNVKQALSNKYKKYYSYDSYDYDIFFKKEDDCIIDYIDHRLMDVTY